MGMGTVRAQAALCHRGWGMPAHSRWSLPLRGSQWPKRARMGTCGQGPAWMERLHQRASLRSSGRPVWTLAKRAWKAAPADWLRWSWPGASARTKKTEPSSLG